jgi:AAHS family 4-hydroxybenzoate transporter-like MFS transporter
MDPRIVSFRGAMDKRPVSKFQFRLVAVAAILLVMDGYDIQAISYVAPVLSNLWHIDRGAFGPIFGAGLVGLALGTLVLSPVADRIGCRLVLTGCMALYALATLATAMVESWGMLLALRFVTGIGLGGVLPTTIAVVSDYSPTRIRNLMVVLSMAGFAIGGSLGGFVAAATIERFGWQSVFLIGGIVPLLLLPILMRWFPESLLRLLSVPRLRPRLDEIIAAVVPGWWAEQAVVERSHQSTKERFPVAALFGDGYAKPTIFIWSIFFCGILLFYFVVNWLPTVVHSSGQSLELANMTGAIFQLCGLPGGFAFAIVADRTGRPQWVLALAFLGAAVSCYFCGAAGSSPALIVASAAAVGFCLVGGNGAAIAFAGNYYPASIRATGVGWALGIGRLGSILGPVVGGLLITFQVSTPALFGLFAVPALLAAICAISIKRSPEQSSLNSDYTTSARFVASGVNDIK